MSVKLRKGVNRRQLLAAILAAPAVSLLPVRRLRPLRDPVNGVYYVTGTAHYARVSLSPLCIDGVPVLYSDPIIIKGEL